MLRHIGCAVALAAGLAVAGAAEASVCRGELPADTAEIRGPVLHVPDGERICVALSPDPRDWVELRVADASLAEDMDRARGALMAASFGQDVTCRFNPALNGGVAACRTANGDVAGLVQTPRIIKAGQAWR